MRQNEILELASAVPGFLSHDEGRALNAYAKFGPMLEIGSYCGKSTLYLGAAAQRFGTHLFAVDPHRGSPENQPGQPYHDAHLVGDDGRYDTLPLFRSTIAAAELEDVVIPIVGTSGHVARYWNIGLAFLFIDGDHAVALTDYQMWGQHVLDGGVLAFHDVRHEGELAPLRAWEHAVSDGFRPLETLGSLRLLRRA